MKKILQLYLYFDINSTILVINIEIMFAKDFHILSERAFRYVRLHSLVINYNRLCSLIFRNIHFESLLFTLIF